MFPNRAKAVSLLATSLVLGIGLLVNLDSGIYRSGIEASGESFHGWPLVYLHRIPGEFSLEADSTPQPWPWPPQTSERRVFSLMNFLTDFIVLASATLIAYMLTHSIGRHVFSPSKGEQGTD